MSETEKSYKQRHEEFVSDLLGGPVSEVYIVTLIAASAYMTWATLQSRMRIFENPSLASRLLDFFLNWAGPLLSVTLYSSTPLLLNALVVVPAIFIAASEDPATDRSKKLNAKKASPTDLEQYLARKPYLSVYRGGMMIITCVAILAVDFPIFPRRFAKVETWGTSLMDLGVGSFVFSMGLVSARSTLISTFLDKPRSSVLTELKNAVSQSASVLALGLIRLAAVKYLGYQEHVTEYGVHWNFFMTLGFMPLFVALLRFIPHGAPLAVVALAIAALYEAALDFTALGPYILAAPRVDIISQNKEGIFSFCGYLAIFLAGKATGYYLLPTTVSQKSFWAPQTKNEYNKSKTADVDTRWRVIGMLLTSSFFHNALLQGSLAWLTVSRRLANLPYVLWTISYNTAFISIFVAIDLFAFPKSKPAVTIPESLDAINYNGLFIFLVANILTGVINMNFKTLDSDIFSSMSILAVYCFTLYAASIGLYRYGIRIKLR